MNRQDQLRNFDVTRIWPVAGPKCVVSGCEVAGNSSIEQVTSKRRSICLRAQRMVVASDCLSGKQLLQPDWQFAHAKTGGVIDRVRYGRGRSDVGEFTDS